MDEFWSVQTRQGGTKSLPAWWRTERSRIESNEEAEALASDLVQQDKKRRVRIRYHETYVVWESK